MPDSEQPKDAGVPLRLRLNPPAGVEQEDGKIGIGSAGCHIAGVLLMAGSVGQNKLPPGRTEVAVGDIDGDALFAFRPQAVGQKGQLQALARGEPHCMQLVFEDTLGIVEQATDERGLAIIHAAGGNQAKQVLLRFRVQELLGLDLLGDGCAQKYPALFFSSIEPSWSWSMTRFSRSERRNETSSSMILGSVSASERMAPVHGLQPRERIRHITSSGDSPGRRGINGCSTERRDSPRTSTGRSFAKYRGTIGMLSRWMYCHTSISVQFDSGKMRTLSAGPRRLL